jgi:hypothetical protein
MKRKKRSWWNIQIIHPQHLWYTPSTNTWKVDPDPTKSHSNMQHFRSGRKARRCAIALVQMGCTIYLSHWFFVKNSRRINTFEYKPSTK